MPETHQPTTTNPPDAVPGYRVDDLHVDTGCARVTRSGTEIPMPKLSFDLLLALIKAAPRIVTTDELMERVWPGLVISPETISQRVKLLRAALDDDSKQPHYIAVVRGRGYRLIAPVAPLNEAGEVLNRRIAAILAADVVDYSRLMGIDEESTLAGLKLRRSIFDRLVAECGGHEFGSVGDSLMAEFPSVVNAVRCAQATQQRVAEENAPLPPEQRMHLRIGVNLGDVIEENGSAFGDAVNVAARLQALARPGGVLISGPVYDQVRNKLPARFIDAGARHVKNIAEPVRTFEVLPAELPGVAGKLSGFFAHLTSRPVRRTAVGVTVLVAALLAYGWYVRAWQAREAPAIQPAERLLAATELPPRSIAVLPFDNLSSAPDSDVLALGISETVLHQLANLRELVVIARTSSFAFRGRNEDAREIGRKLNVRYLLEGSVQSDQQRLRITAQLIDASTGAHIWSIRRDKTLKDLFAVQDEIALEVARALELSLDSNAMAKLTEKGTTNIDAYLEYLQARTLLASLRVTEMEAAAEQLSRAIQIDPNFAPAYVTLAGAKVLLAEFEVTDDRQVRFEAAVRQGKTLLEKALALDSKNGEAYVERGYLTAFTDLAGAEADYRRGLELSPNYAKGYEGLAAVLYETPTRRGEALAMLDRARQLDPLEPRYDVSKSVFLFYGRGNAREASELLVRVLEQDPLYEPALNRLAEIRRIQGEFAEGAKLAEQALSLDPLAEWTRRVLEGTYLDMGDVAAAQKVIEDAQYPLAVRWIPVHLYRHDWRRAGEIAYAGVANETLTPIDETLAVAAIRMYARATGDYARARTALEKMSGITWNDDGYPSLLDRVGMKNDVVGLADMLRASGQETPAKRLLEASLAVMEHEARQLERGELWYFRTRATAQALLGHSDAAIETLQQLVAGVVGSDIWWYYFEIEPAFADLRTDPRFKALLATVRAHAATQRERLTELRAAGLVPTR